MINQVLPWIFIGDCDSAWDLETLERLGVKAIFNLHGHDDPELDGIKQFQFRFIDGEGNSWETIREILDTIEDQRRNGKVLVHCCAGMSRSPFIVLSYLVVKEDEDIDRAMNRIAKKHPRLSIHPHLIELLRENEEDAS